MGVIRQLKNAMETAPEADETEDMVLMLYETAALIGGYTIEDPGDFAKRVTKLMESMGSGGGGAGSVDAEVVASCCGNDTGNHHDQCSLLSRQHCSGRAQCLP